MEEASKQLTEFVEQLVRLGGTLGELFKSGNVALISEMNAAVKEMYRLQHGSSDKVLQALEPECAVIYGNFDMIVQVLRTTENGEVDAGAGGAVNRLLRNINGAVVNIATALGLVSE